MDPSGYAEARSVAGGLAFRNAPTGENRGRLVIVGSGIKAIGHFTLEAQAHIQQADIVLYSVADPVSELWVQRQNPNHFDLREEVNSESAQESPKDGNLSGAIDGAGNVEEALPKDDQTKDPKAGDNDSTQMVEQ